MGTDYNTLVRIMLPIQLHYFIHGWQYIILNAEVNVTNDIFLPQTGWKSK